MFITVTILVFIHILTGATASVDDGVGKVNIQGLGMADGTTTTTTTTTTKPFCPKHVGVG
jgi:hypothetical protein